MVPSTHEFIVISVHAVIMSLSKLALFWRKARHKGNRLSLNRSPRKRLRKLCHHRRRSTMLEFISGIGVTNLGHCHLAVTKAAQAQLGELFYGQVKIAFQKLYLDVIESLLPLIPRKSLDIFFFWNSGSEAVEAAVKLPRHATKKQNVVVMQSSYEGLTFRTIAMTR